VVRGRRCSRSFEVLEGLIHTGPGVCASFDKHSSALFLTVLMQTMNISLPGQMKEFVVEQVGSGRYSSVSEYVRELIRNDERRRSQDKLEAMLLEGIQSGESSEMTREDWADIRRKAVKQLEARKSRKPA